MKKIRKVALISPSVMLSERDLKPQIWIDYFAALGIDVVLLPTSLGGSKLETFQAKDKARDIMAAYLDNSIDALVAVHGGAQALRVLEYLDFAQIKTHNKPIIGFSDTTSLQFGVFGKTNNSYLTGFCPEYDFRDGVIAPMVDAGIKNWLLGKKFVAQGGCCVNSGVVEGVLIGGNMSAISDLSGTPYFPDLRGKILLLEDECEPAYKLKLMLTQLKYNPTFGQVKGIVFGRFSECIDNRTQGSVDSVVDDFAAQVNLPMIKDFNYGHFKERLVIPCGMRYCFDATSCRLEQID